MSLYEKKNRKNLKSKNQILFVAKYLHCNASLLVSKNLRSVVKHLQECSLKIISAQKLIMCNKRRVGPN